MARMHLEKPLGLIPATGSEKNYNSEIRIVGVAYLIYSTIRLERNTRSNTHRQQNIKQHVQNRSSPFRRNALNLDLNREILSAF